MKRLFFLSTLLLLLLTFGSSGLQAQVSTVDTLRIEDVTGEAGSTIEVVLSAVTSSINLGAFNMQIEIDTNIIKPVTIEDNGDFFIDYDLLEISSWDFSAPGAQFVQYLPEQQVIRGLFAQNPDNATNLSPGYYQLLKMYFVIQPDLADNTTSNVDLYSDFSTPGAIIITMSDADGLVTIEPTLDDGTVTVGGGVIPGENQPPIIDALTSPYNVEPGQNVNFNIRAHDPDGDNLSLTAQNLPSGASMNPNPAEGDSLVTAVFNWTPNNSQTGSFTVTFRAEDDSSNVSSRSVTINVTQVVINNDSLMAASSQRFGVKGGIPGATEVAVPIDLFNIHDIYGVQFDVEYDDNMFRLDSITPTDRLTGYAIYDNIGTTAGSVRVLTYGLNNETVIEGTNGNTIMYFWMTVRSSAIPGRYRFKISDAWESINPDPLAESEELPYDSMGLVAVDMMGDINLDTRIDVADLVSLVGSIIGDWTLTTRQFRTANINGDAQADVVDLVAILNAILSGGTPSPAPFASYNGPDAEFNIDYGDPYGGISSSLVVDADLPTDVAGVQMEILYDPENVKLHEPIQSPRCNGLRMKYSDRGDGRMVVLMYFKSGNINEVVKAGLGEIITVPIQSSGNSSLDSDKQPIVLNDVVLSDANGSEIPVVGYSKPLPTRFNLAQNYPNPFNPRTTIEYEVLASPEHPYGDDIELVVYNLLGQKVKTLASGFHAPGLYTEVWDGTDDAGNRQASGVYFYSLIASESRMTKKMVFMK